MLSIYIVFSNCLGSCWWSPRRHVLFVFSGAFSKLDEKLKEDNWLSSLGAQKKSDGLDMKHGHFQSERIDEDRLGPHSFFGVPCGGGGGGPKNIYGGSHAIHGWLERPPSRQDSGRCLKRRHCWHVGHVDGWRTLSRFRLVQLTKAVAGVRKSLFLILYLRFPWVVILSGTAFVLYHWVNDEKCVKQLTSTKTNYINNLQRSPNVSV
jgi:hypothetical protein